MYVVGYCKAIVLFSLKTILILILKHGVSKMVKISQFKNQYRITIPPEIITALGIDPDKNYDWIMDGQGLPAIRERR